MALTETNKPSKESLEAVQQVIAEWEKELRATYVGGNAPIISNFTSIEQRLARLLDSERAKARLEEAKLIQGHMDRYLNRDCAAMEIFLFVEERIAALESKQRKALSAVEASTTEVIK